jgi:hypothetical protein
MNIRHYIISMIFHSTQIYLGCVFFATIIKKKHITRCVSVLTHNYFIYYVRSLQQICIIIMKLVYSQNKTNQISYKCSHLYKHTCNYIHVSCPSSLLPERHADIPSFP